MRIHESAENYLETILMLRIKNPYVRSIDIANELGFSKPSVSVAMKNLRENGYVNVDSDGYITLTDKGKKLLKLCMSVISGFLLGLCVLVSMKKLLLRMLAE